MRAGGSSPRGDQIEGTASGRRIFRPTDDEVDRGHHPELMRGLDNVVAAAVDVIIDIAEIAQRIFCVMPDSVTTSSFIVRACATALRMFFERPDELIATRQSPARALSLDSMRKPVLETVIIGKARHHAGIAEAECGHRCVLRQIDREMGGDAGRAPIADEDERPPCSRARNQAVRVAEILAKIPSSIAVARWRRPT